MLKEKHPVRTWARQNNIQNDVIANALSITKEQTSRILNLKCEPSTVQIFQMASLIYTAKSPEWLNLVGEIVYVHAMHKIIKEADV